LEESIELLKIRERWTKVSSDLEGWAGLKYDEEDDRWYAPECSYLGSSLIALEDTYENSGNDCNFLANARKDIEFLLNEITTLRRKIGE
jgi:hypothetical protein